MKEKTMKPHMNEWMNSLLSKINNESETTSEICAFMCGLMDCPLEKIKSIELDWVYITDDNFFKAKPKIKINFK